MDDQELRVALPPRARLTGLTFDDNNRVLHANLAGLEGERKVAADHDVDELRFLVADSFDFRTTLADAGLGSLVDFFRIAGTWQI